MNYRNLIRDHVVNLILSYPTHCTFINYGGKEDGIKELQSRIMKSFDVPETGYLQSCYVGKRLSVKKVFQLISELVSRDQLDKVIDLWKEICNQQHDLSSDLRLVGYLQEIELVGIRNGYSSYQFLNIVAPTLKYSSHAKVEEFITSAMDYAEKAIDAKTATGCEYYIEKLKRVLVSYPFIQTKFIVEKFGQDFLDELSELNSSEVRANTLWSKLKELNEYKMKKSVTDSNKDLPVNEEVKTNQPEEAGRKMLEAMKQCHPPAKPYVQFLGTEHLIAPIFNWAPNLSRLAQECSLIGGLMASLSNGDKPAIGIVKALIHRSPNQKTLCRDIFILPDDFLLFDSLDSRKRGMILDEIFDKMGEKSKVRVKKDPLSFFPEYPNLTEEEEGQSQPKEESFQDRLNKATACKCSVCQKNPSHPFDSFFNTSPPVSRLQQLFKTKRPDVETGTLGRLINMANQLNVSFEWLTGVDPSTLTEKECDSDCPCRRREKGQHNHDPLKTQHPDSEELHEHQQRVVDLIVGIEPEMEGRIAFLNLDRGKQRSEGHYDFRGLFKFLDAHYNPKPAATEIETSTNVVINQKFVINDVKGEFFCEYKMIWTPTMTQFMFTHDKPDNKAGRQFHHIRELNKPMTQDKAFSQFQSLRHNVITHGPHKPKPNPYTGY